MGLFSAFFGDSQRDDLRAANRQATEKVEQGKTESIQTRRNTLDQSLGFLEGGRGAQNLLLQALGVQGPQAQEGFFAGFQNDPGFQRATQFGIDQLDNSAAARGSLLSGGQVRDVADFGMRRQQDAFNNRINQLFQLQGNAPALSAAASQDTGDQIAATQFGTGQLQANQATNFGNALAQSRSIPINNLLALGQTAAKVAGAF